MLTIVSAWFDTMLMVPVLGNSAFARSQLWRFERIVLRRANFERKHDDF